MFRGQGGKCSSKTWRFLEKKLLQNLEVLVSKIPLTMKGGGLDLSRLESDGTQQ